jgi:hydroxyethylthiazole kinase
MRKCFHPFRKSIKYPEIGFAKDMVKDGNSIWLNILRIREENPLIHNITNFVVMNTTANALLAIGASPVMAHAIEEVEEMVGHARALVINIGTLSASWVRAMVQAGKEAQRLKIPVVLDPVGCGATQFRTDATQELMREISPAIIRGNASEIRSIVCNSAGGKGVDSIDTPGEVIDEARVLSSSTGSVVSISGPMDLIVEGARVARVYNGHPMMSRVTGMGCTASAITGAFAAVHSSYFEAAVQAMAVIGVAGEIAAERSAGPASFQMHFLDTLYQIGESDIERRVKIEGA